MSEDKTPERNKLRLKLGDAEFEAEGTSFVVNQQLEAFLQALSSLPRASSSGSSPLKGVDELHEREAADSRDVATDDPDHSQAGPAKPSPALSRFYSTSRDVISLRHLPQTKDRDADALLMILYGYSKLKDQHDVLAIHLMRAARQSGVVNLDRLDRTMLKCKPLILRGGSRKGTTYALNTQGERHVEALFQSMLGG